ncbi:PEP-CTERM sorting domain-containing protein [Roseisolibacter agri]|uniref:Ice-binding protein C-terminal domain-containing protein n=1 Tax=Roseisolibacter agri TaxID=2014610 RepID=A0AA37Q840_9BACT|nr:PEP-CTERM sorting domain-containing protein [Roseisolibacter agri]GLC25472.1 hypothetical protein rosag_19850 [Roseisolibacter agri]
MRTLRLLATLAVLAPVLAAAPAGAQQVTVGTVQNANCIPFGCDFDVSRYQQVYAGGAFGGAAQITSLSFLLGSAPNSFLSPVTYTVRLGYTNAAVGGLNAALDANVAGGLTTFATRSFGIGPAAPPVLTFTGLTPFAFDPAAGNLLLDILVDGQVGADVGGWASYASDNSGTVTSRAYVQGGTAGGDETGLVTQFGLVATPTSTVPEPTTAVLLGAGLLGVAGVGARRRAR